MDKGFTYLINWLNSPNSHEFNYITDLSGEMMKRGILLEPQRFGDFVDAYASRLMGFFPNRSEKETGRDALMDVARGMVRIDYLVEDCDVGMYFKDSRLYGYAMEAFSKYVGLCGNDLVDFLEGEYLVH